MSKFAVFLMLLASIAPLGCIHHEERTVEASPPLEKVHYFASRVTFYLHADAHVDELVRMDIFDGFSPGISIEEAVSRVGQPNETGENNFGPFYTFERPAGKIVLSFEKHDSWPSDSPGRWYLNAHPEGWTQQDAFATPILGHLAASQEGQQEVVIMRPDGRGPAVRVFLTGNKVDSMYWCASAAGGRS